MKTVLFISALLLSAQAASEPLSTYQIEQILNHKDRPKEDRNRDLARQPDKVLAFSRIAKGDHVLDLFSGGGWYTELFSKAVGANGKVYAQNDEVIWKFAEKELTKRTQNNRLPNLVRFDNMPVVQMAIPDKSLDLAFVALNYHDFFFTQYQQDGKTIQVRDKPVDHKAALNTIKQALKDDGVFIIIDHFAKAGSGFEAVNTLHRIDPEIIKNQMRQAGFTLIEEAFYLRNSHDDLADNVFAPRIRGKTDRFIYKFTKE